MGLRKLTMTDLGMAQAQAFLNRPIAILESGAGDLSYSLPVDPTVMFTVTDIILSGEGTFTITEGGETVLALDVSGALAIPFKIALNLDLKNQVTFSFTGTGAKKLNVYGYYVRK